MASLLVIGGTGFFGKSILDAHKRGLLKKFDIDSVIALSRSASRLRIDNPELISVGIELIDADISTCSSLPIADYVIHAAASTDARRYAGASDVEYDNILSGISNYCALAKKHHCQSKIVYVSSGAVYGPQPENLKAIPEDYQFSGSVEKMSETKRAYALAKRGAESMIIDLGRQGLNVSIARCFSFIGAYLPRNQHFAIGNFLEHVLHNEEILVKAQGRVYRSYMHADDLVEWLLEIGNKSDPRCPIYNVGSNEAIQIQELGKKIAMMYGLKVAGADLNGLAIGVPVDRYVPSINKALSDHLALRYSLTDAILKTIDDINRIFKR
ncbi:NAD(P)-dependent oxidoreductase [Polynucleobacter paneuropaeus]|nr:NAD(P)-dependent oxidoreductase [Polynucleobacter paneuropaeus]